MLVPHAWEVKVLYGGDRVAEPCKEPGRLCSSQNFRVLKSKSKPHSATMIVTQDRGENGLRPNETLIFFPVLNVSS